MVDVAQRTATLPPLHSTPAPLRRLSGLRRLSVRASSAAPSTPSRTAASSFADLASSILSHLSLSSVVIEPGLSDSDLVRIESELSITFPPDLRTLLSLGLPSGNGFPNWRQRPLQRILDVPLKKSALPVGQSSSLRKAPHLIPVYKNCYIPASPGLAGNPVFRVEEYSVAIAGVDLADFFSRETGFLQPSTTSLRRQLSASLPPLQPSCSPSTLNSRRSLDSMAGKTPRWIEFWTDAAAAATRTRRRSGSADLTDQEQLLVFEIRSVEIEKVPKWVSTYLDEIGAMLRSGGWCESDVREMVHVAASDRDGKTDGHDDALERCGISLRKAGWKSDEVLDVLRLGDLERRCPVKRSQVRLPPKVPLAVIRPR